jgi:hypothetical protein
MLTIYFTAIFAVWYTLCMNSLMTTDAALVDKILVDLRLHGDSDLTASRTGVPATDLRKLLVYTGPSSHLRELSVDMQLAQAEGRGNQKHYAKTMFLDALSRHASVVEAVASQRWYSFEFFETWRAKDTEFALQWERALERAVDSLRREAWRRGAEGYDEPVTHKGQYCYQDDPVTGKPEMVTVRKYSDHLLTTMLKRYDPAFRERIGVDTTAAIEGGLTQDAAMAALSKLSAEELAVLNKLLDVSEQDA